MNRILTALTLLLFSISGQVALGQNHKTYTVDDYDRAVAMLGTNVNKLVDSDIRPQWLPDSRLWYSCKIDGETEYKLFDPAKGKPVVGC